MDTLEHVTDFKGATDHTQTLRKFQQMSVPMLGHHRSPRFLSERSATSTSFRSAFEEEEDNTYIEKSTEQMTEGKGGINSAASEDILASLQAFLSLRLWKDHGLEDDP